MQSGEGGLLSEGEQPLLLRLMQNNAPAHAAGSTQEQLHDRFISVISWPPFSPDLIPSRTAGIG